VADSIGGIPVVAPPTIGDFPITVDFGGGLDLNPPIAIHVFDAPELKTEQRFVMGPGMRRLRVRRDHLNKDEYALLKSHWLQAQGQYAQFNIRVAGPGSVGAMETWTCRYENPNLSFDQVAGMLTGDPGLTLLVVADAPLPPYTSVAQVTRFPDSILAGNLAEQTQHIYPLVIIQDQTRSGGALVNQPNYFSNQRVTVDGHEYLPRLLTWSGVSQTLSEASDSTTFTFGNADDAFTNWGNACNLNRAVVQLSLYHAESGYLIYMWGGYALPWSLDTGGKFVLPCSNGTFELTLGYPTRTITRQCWKVYKGRFCPSTASFPDCPKDYDSCVARGVPTSFGGVAPPHQAFQTKDSSTGVMGWGRSWITSVSITSDTIFQNVLQEVWTNEAMLIDAPIICGRDEDTFYAALGMVSDGPIGAYNPNQAVHQLDNQPPHDAVRAPIRGVLGNDPANTAYDFLAISQAPWDQVPPGATYSGGLAFAEIRRTDAAGLQLAPLTEHKMQIGVTQGVGGWVWDAPGSRRWVPGLTNTVWVAVNVYLRALGLRVSPGNAGLISAATMEQYFDCNQAIASAAICDLVVDKIIPSDGTKENQFPFRGILKERKPLKDWLNEILNCCLGYWTFVNGKLWIGIRENASVLAENAFNRAQVKWKTLQTAPVKAAFNWLNVQFGDEEYNWALNAVTVYDIDHASFVGTPDSPQYLQSNMMLVGCSNLSQAARIGTTRLREETGGLGPTEQRNARNFRFQTTVLALTTQVGDIISLTHPMMPGGIAKGRVRSWTLNPDFSIDIEASCVTDAMYDLDQGPKPTDVAPPPLPVQKLAWAEGMAWMPNLIAPFAGDPLYPDILERTFDIWQDYNLADDGTWSPAIFVSGFLMVNQFVSLIAPRISTIIVASGGSLSGGQTINFNVTMYDANGESSSPSNLAAIWIPDGATNQKITLGLMPPNSGTWAGWDLRAGTDRRTLSLQHSAAGAVPATYDFLGPVHPYTRGMPTTVAQYVQVGVKHVVHSGIAGMLVTGVTAPNQIQCDDFIGSTDAWVGRMVSAIADAQTGHAPLWDFEIMTFNSVTGTLTVSPDCVYASPSDSVKTGDVLIVRSVVDNISPDGLTVGDPGWNNSVGRNQFGADGLAPGAEIGHIARIIRGKGQGQYAHIVNNDKLTITLATPFQGVDRTSIVIIEEANWANAGQSSPLPVVADGQQVSIRVPVNNLGNMVVLAGGFLNDGEGHLTDERYAVFREIFVFGQPPNVRTLGPGANDTDGNPWQITPDDQTIAVDTGTNDVNVQVPPLAAYAGRTLLIFNLGANSVIVTPTGTETFYDGSTVQTLTGQGNSLRITSSGDYSVAARKTARRKR